MYKPEEIRQMIIQQGVLDVAIEDVQSLSEEDYALARKNYFGASDSSVLCGVNLYKNMDALIKEKNAKYLTAEEKEVGKKPIVQKGRDLEPIILAKAEAQLGMPIHKPIDMFKFNDVDGLSLNYDGIMTLKENELIPVEAKLVSKYGEKYYNKLITPNDAKVVPMNVEGTDLESHIKRKATRFGIPAYYYTQVQQEIAGVNAEYGYLAAMFDETWTFKLYYIPRDEYVINNIYNRCANNIDKIKRD
jgi:hypothetical protein